MMKPTELRLGNWIYGVNRRGRIDLPIEQPLKILQIGIFNCEALPIDINPAQVEQWIKLSNSDITPISINLEWLIKLGFPENGSTRNLIDNYHLCFERIGEDLFVSNGMANRVIYKIENLHEAQNIYFLLTGKELEII